MKLKLDKPKSASVRCHASFIDTLKVFINAFEDKYKVKMSTEEATKLINQKIIDSGGLIV